MRRKMKERGEQEEERNDERRRRVKKSQILYFDIFYVDLDSTAELYRGFSSFRAISHECVSCFTLLPTDSERMIFQSKNMNTRSDASFFPPHLVQPTREREDDTQHTRKTRRNINFY